MSPFEVGRFNQRGSYPDVSQCFQLITVTTTVGNQGFLPGFT